MFCTNCGAQISDGEKFCPNCGEPVNTGSEIKGFVLQDDGLNGDNGSGAENSEANTADNAGGNFSGGNTYYNPYGPHRLDFNKSFWMYVLLSWVTCGIYGLVFMYQLIRDVNIACDGDGETTPGLLQLILLSIVTCGIYSFIWHYKLGNRLSNNCKRYGFNVAESGLTVLLWMIFSSWLCGIGTYVAKYIIISQTNNVCLGYNRANGLM